MSDTERVPVGTIVSYHGTVFTEFTLYLIAGYNEDVTGERPDLPANVITRKYPGNFGYRLFPVGVPYKMDNQHLLIDFVRRSSFDVVRTPGDSELGGQS